MATLPKTPPPFLYSLKGPSTFLSFYEKTLSKFLFSNKPFFPYKQNSKYNLDLS